MKVLFLAIISILVCAASVLCAAEDGIVAAFPKLEGLGESFSFAIFADPQVGHKDDRNPVPTNARQTQMLAIQELSAIAPSPAFAVFLGDLVNAFDEQSVASFEECLSGLQAQPVLVHGNHDTHAPYTAFRELMKRVCGIDGVYYSFDVGRWHFIVLPCNLTGNHPEEQATETGMLAWLARDLEANRDRPTMVFEHFHALPQGLTQLEWYNFPLDLRLKVIYLLTRHGNVHYYFNGHVHNGIKTSVKTSWRYKGINFINAPTIIRTRNFGEEYPDFQRGQEDGGYYLIVEIKGENAKVKGHLAGEACVFEYPSRLREFSDKLEPRWFRRVPELPATPALVNGEFSKGLKGWTPCYRYACEGEAGFLAETREPSVGKAGKAAYVLTRSKEPVSWANDEMMEIYQMVSVPESGMPVLNTRYCLEQAPKNGGGYIRVAAIGNTVFRFMMMFKWGENERNADITPRAFGYALYGKQMGWTFLRDLGSEKRGMYWNIPDQPNIWHQLDVNVAALYDEAQGVEGAYGALGITKLFLALGTWTNKEAGSTSAAYFDGVFLVGGQADSQVDGTRLECGDSVFETEFGQALADREEKKNRRKP